MYIRRLASQTAKNSPASPWQTGGGRVERASRAAKPGQRRVREAARRRGGGERSERFPAGRPGRTPARRFADEARRADEGAERCLHRNGEGGAWRGGAPVTIANLRGGAARSPARLGSAPASKSPRHRNKTGKHIFSWISPLIRFFLAPLLRRG